MVTPRHYSHTRFQ